MSRRTDAERGARLAHEIALQHLVQSKLFPTGDAEALDALMRECAAAANRTIAECEWSRQVIAG